MPDRLESHGYVHAIDLDNRRVTVVVSTGDIARDGAIIQQDGWNLGNYERNPVVLWGHDDHSLPIARTISTTTGANELIQVHEFASHPRAQEVFDAVNGGFVNATSVRWTPGETEVRTISEGKNKRQVLVYTRGHELLEVSYVPIPADPGALVLRADGSRVDVADYLPRAEPVEEPEEAPTAGVDVDAIRAERLLRFAAALRGQNPQQE